MVVETRSSSKRRRHGRHHCSSPVEAADTQRSSKRQRRRRRRRRRCSPTLEAVAAVATPTVGSPLLDELPEFVMGQILPYLDLPSLMQFAGCSKDLEATIFEEEKQSLWTKIDFGICCPRPQAAALTDFQLDRLLCKTHAHENCQKLYLNGCTSIRGLGLEPLRGSCVLRELDLRLHPTTEPGPVEIDIDTCLNLLNSMPPNAVPAANPDSQLPQDSLGLALVIFRPQNHNEDNFYSRFDDTIADWYHDFYENLQAQAVERKLRCGYCQRILSDILSDEHLDSVVTNYCEKCMKYSCEDSPDCPLIMDCHVCMVQCCQQTVEQDLSPEHVGVFICDSCGIFGCENCFDGGIMCNKCHAVWYCDNCTDEWCRKCPKKGCEGYYCTKCIDAHKAECDADDDSSVNGS